MDEKPATLTNDNLVCLLVGRSRSSVCSGCEPCHREESPAVSLEAQRKPIKLLLELWNFQSKSIELLEMTNNILVTRCLTIPNILTIKYEFYIVHVRLLDEQYFIFTCI